MDATARAIGIGVVANGADVTTESCAVASTPRTGCTVGRALGLVVVVRVLPITGTAVESAVVDAAVGVAV